MKNIRWGWGLALTLLMTFGVATGASAQVRIGLVLDGSTAQAESNIAYFVSQNPGYTFTTIPDVTALNALSVAELNATYDVLVVPWQITSAGDFDWDTRLLPYLTNGGSVLWEDPDNIGDLASSGVTLTSSPSYPGIGTADISLDPPFDSNGAIGWFHIHFGITGVTDPAWLVWSSDIDGGIHGVYAQFGAGRMVMGISDNLYHPDMSNTSDPASVGAYNLLRNELNWLRTGSVNGGGSTGTNPIPTLSEWAIGLLALILALIGIATVRNRRLTVQR